MGDAVEDTEEEADGEGGASTSKRSNASGGSSGSGDINGVLRNAEAVVDGRLVGDCAETDSPGESLKSVAAEPSLGSCFAD